MRPKDFGSVLGQDKGELRPCLKITQQYQKIPLHACAVHAGIMNTFFFRPKVSGSVTIMTALLNVQTVRRADMSNLRQIHSTSGIGYGASIYIDAETGAIWSSLDGDALEVHTGHHRLNDAHERIARHCELMRAMRECPTCGYYQDRPDYVIGDECEYCKHEQRLAFGVSEGLS